MSASSDDALPRRAVLVGVLLVLTFLAAAISILVGRDGGGPTLGFGGPELAEVILTEIRVPRTLLALIVGGTLGLTGAALQGLLRNPLAEPGLLGASSGAALGAVIVFYFGFATATSLLLPLGAVPRARKARRFAHDRARRNRDQRARRGTDLARAELRAEPLCRARDLVLDAGLAR